MPTQNISATFTAQQLIDLKDDIEALAPQFPTLVTLTEAERWSLPRVRFPPGRKDQRGTMERRGPPFAQAVVDGVTTLDPGNDATVEVSFDGANVHFTFGLPRGSDGGEGPTGASGEVPRSNSPTDC